MCHGLSAQLQEAFPNPDVRRVTHKLLDSRACGCWKGATRNNHHLQWRPVKMAERGKGADWNCGRDLKKVKVRKLKAEYLRLCLSEDLQHE